MLPALSPRPIRLLLGGLALGLGLIRPSAAVPPSPGEGQPPIQAAAAPQGAAHPAEAPQAFTPLWIDASARLSSENLQSLLDGVKAQEPEPQDIVLLVHGFATSRADSTAQFNLVGSRIHEAYRRRGGRVAVVGVQWDSDVGSILDIMPALVGNALGFARDSSPYLAKVRLADKVGRMGLRQAVLALAQRFPKATLAVMAHSLGSQVTASCGAPSINPNAYETYEPDKDVPLRVACLAGADLDYDLLKRNRTAFTQESSLRLIWLTVGTDRRTNSPDAVLSLRGLLRGEALGNEFPRMSRKQIEFICRTQRLVLDDTDVPFNHNLTDYYSEARLARMIDAIIHQRNPAWPSAVLDKIKAVLEAHNNIGGLVPLLADPDLSVQYYTLWRLDNLMCGQPAHVAEGHLNFALRTFRANPGRIADLRHKSDCKVIREGLWPTARQVNQMQQEDGLVEAQDGHFGDFAP